MAIYLPIITKFDEKGVDNAIGKIGKLGAQAGKIAAGGLAALGAATIASVKAFADFDAEMTKSIAIMGNVSDSLRDDMSDAAREVAKTTTFSANEAAESYFFLASAGLDAAQSIAALPKVAQFAQAGMFDMATATDLLTDAQSALGLTSDDAAENLENMARLSDVLIKANTLANASVQQFSEALTNKAAASMRSLNIATEEGVAVLAVFADQGIKGSQAGTTFNATIRGLTNGVQRNAEEFERLNVQVFNAEGEMNNMADIVGQLETALGDLSVEQQRAELTALGFTEETLAGTLALIGNSEAIREYETALGNAAGTTENVANNQLQTLNAQLGLIKSAFVDLGIEIGERLEPTMTELAEEVQRLIAEMVASPDFEEFIVELTIAMRELIPAFIELLPPLTEFIVALIPLAIDLMPILIGLLDGLVQILNFFTGAIDEAKFSTEDLDKEFGELMRLIVLNLPVLGSWVRIYLDIANAIMTALSALERWIAALRGAPAVDGAGLFPVAGARRNGGPVTGGLPYLVGEDGPEIFMPSASGTIIPNGGFRGMGSTVNITVNAGMGADGARVGEAVVKAIRQYERTSGRVFASA